MLGWRGGGPRDGVSPRDTADCRIVGGRPGRIIVRVIFGSACSRGRGGGRVRSRAPRGIRRYVIMEDSGSAAAVDALVEVSHPPPLACWRTRMPGVPRDRGASSPRRPRSSLRARGPASRPRHDPPPPPPPHSLSVRSLGTCSTSCTTAAAWASSSPSTRPTLPCALCARFGCGQLCFASTHLLQAARSLFTFA